MNVWMPPSATLMPLVPTLLDLTCAHVTPGFMETEWPARISTSALAKEQATTARVEVRPRASTLLGLSLVLATLDIQAMERLALVLSFFFFLFLSKFSFFLSPPFKIDINECSNSTWNNCDSNATCANTPGSFYCTCKSGFFGTGTSCTDYNECLNQGTGNNCNIYATCTNTPGSFYCTCNSGFNGTGVTCTEYNECIGQNGGNNCANGTSTCTNTPGSFTCACNSGFSGNGVTCTDYNECLGQGSDNNCANGTSTCTNTVGSFTCACNSGFNGTGVTCTGNIIISRLCLWDVLFEDNLSLLSCRCGWMYVGNWQLQLQCCLL